MMEEGDRNTIHGTAEISTGNREDLFKPTVTETLVNIVCGGKEEIKLLNNIYLRPFCVFRNSISIMKLIGSVL